MTISEYVSEFLKLYENIKIDTNHVEDGSDKYGLFKSPARDFRRNTDGSATITEYFEFLASQRSVSDIERKEDDEWLEAFTYWMDDYPLEYNYPEIDGGRMVTEIRVTGSTTPITDDNKRILYQMLLSITYEREVG
ncbi:MAG: hypothetical protein IJ526_07330 [Lachnospiraceae bacterium]|nr:hypothetical protein [Lachnospiraceae bacterium]